jgi:hypothetical protein
MSCRVVALSKNLFMFEFSPSSIFDLRRGSLRFSLCSKRRLVEAAGVEPASENIPHRHLHT